MTEVSKYLNHKVLFKEYIGDNDNRRLGRKIFEAKILEIHGNYVKLKMHDGTIIWRDINDIVIVEDLGEYKPIRAVQEALIDIEMMMNNLDLIAQAIKEKNLSRDKVKELVHDCESRLWRLDKFILNYY